MNETENQEIKIDLTVDTAHMELAAKQVRGALGGLERVAHAAGVALRQAFGYCADAVEDTGTLDKQLLVLRLSLGKLKAAIGRAAAPIAAAFLPTVQQAVYAATRLANTVAKVTAALFGGTQSAQAMASAQTALAKSSDKAARSLASFDELERIDAPSGSTPTAAENLSLPAVQDTLTPQLQAIVDKIQRLLAPLQSIDLSPAQAAFARLGQALSQLGAVIGSALEWAWFNILVPLSRWVIEEMVPASVDVLTAAFTMLAQALGPVLEGIQSLLPQLQPVARFMGDILIRSLQSLGDQFGKVGQAFSDNGGRIRGVFDAIGQGLSTLVGWAKPLLEGLGYLWMDTMAAMGDAAAGQVGFAVQALEGLVDFVAGVLTGDWSRAWDGIETVFQGGVNLLIALMNGLIASIVSGMNAIIKNLNSFRIQVPDWVPLFGGETFRFNLKSFTAPQIPYLAQGAVLPANKPFMAVVGDQRHGTNIEAPLATIQEAVRVEVGELVGAVLTGFEALLAENRQLRRTVEAIEVGDTVIGQAAARYSHRQSVVKGGAL